jgi:predicted phosphate transport protein (TIGR00153 family)
MFRLLPRDEKYFDLFNRVSSYLSEGALILQQLFNDFENHRKYVEQIKKIEHTCDDLTHEIIRRLNQTFITPMDREDIHALASELDDVMDYIEYVGKRIVLFHIENSTPHAQRLTDVVVRMTSTLERAVSALERDTAKVLRECTEMHVLEREGDERHHEAVEELFNEEKDPIKLLKWKELYEALELTIDKCQDAANTLEGIVLKNA